MYVPDKPGFIFGLIYLVVVFFSPVALCLLLLLYGIATHLTSTRRRIVACCVGGYLIVAAYAGWFGYTFWPLHAHSSDSLGGRHEVMLQHRPDPPTLLIRQQVEQERREYVEQWLHITLAGLAIMTLLAALKVHYTDYQHSRPGNVGG